jgi:3-hydroxyacyl-CoA dehydrogenase/3a,7a,12a-trihydroxy-5b-cholest-24-enoyl-CoA hydratase
MANELRFDGRVAIVTGAGGGLGRSHALLLAARGARVVVNDLGGSAQGAGRSSTPAERVVQEIRAAGGEAVVNTDSVEDGAKIVQCALDSFGRLDILVNNAGILRDVSFQKMSEEDWDLVYRVHVLGAFRLTRAAWGPMRDAGYGRVLFTASAAGIYGNFGQANYSMAKLGLVGFCNTLAIEGKKRNVLCNTIAPIAGSRLTETILPKELVEALRPEFVSPLVAYLCHESCTESGGLFEVGGGFMGKLRYERAAGHTFKLSRPITPEGVRDHFAAIAGFDKTTHPADINASMAPILENLKTAKGRGGNEFIDVDEALGFESPPVTSSYTERDASIYALGVGAAQDPLDDRELRHVYELHRDGFTVLPTFAVAPALQAMFKLAQEGKQAPGLRYGFERVLHGEQYTELRRPLPPRAQLTHHVKIKDIFDKGKNAVVITAITTTDETGAELCYNEVTTVVRGAGGFGGDRGPAGETNAAPERAPDGIVTERIGPNQALLYRLSGDWNPLHVDPAFAQGFGFPRPILHGLCTFGYAARHVIRAFADGDARRMKSIKVRFADSVFPGETLITEMWRESDTRILFRCKVAERDKVVISNAAIELFKEIPSADAGKAGAQAQAQAAPKADAPPESADIFAAIADHIERHPELPGKVGTTFAFKLSNPESAWTVDLKSEKGGVTSGVVGSPDVTLELSDADFLAMTTGKADPQQLYFGGKLKISGNIMAAQKLTFLKKMDPQAAMQAIARRRAQAAGSAQAQPASTAPADTLRSEHVFFAIGHHLKTHPELPGQIKTVFQWRLKDPESAWIVDVKNGAGSCTQGVAERPDVTLELSDADFLALCTGKADPQKLYFGGKLKISGNVMAAQKLEFLKKVDPDAAMRAFAQSPAAQAPAASSPAASAPAASAPAQGKAESKAPGIFTRLAERLAQNPGLAAEVGALLQFHIKSPDRSYVVDLRGAPDVHEGTDAAAQAVLTLAEEDLLALLQDPGQARSLYMHGKLRVDGDARVAGRLGFLKGL